MSQFQRLPTVQGTVKYFTQKHWNLAEQDKVKRQNPELYMRLKAEAAEFDCTFAQQVAVRNQRLAELQAERTSNR